MSRFPVEQLHTTVRELDLGTAKVYHLPDWQKLSHPERLKVMRQIATRRGRDPIMAKRAVDIVRADRVAPRSYEGQAAALLRWVQNPQNIYYVNEPGERLQDPLVTLKLRMGDCDDVCLLLGSFFESIGLPWKQVLSGFDENNQKVRWIEGEPLRPGCTWTHIYLCVGTPPFNPTTWYFCEPTIQGVPLGWDVLDGDKRWLPKMPEMERRKGPVRVIAAPPAPANHHPPALPAVRNRSHAYAMAYAGAQRNSSNVASSVGGAVAEEATRGSSSSSAIDWKRLGVAVGTGVAVSVLTQLTLDFVRPVVRRWTGGPPR